MHELAYKVSHMLSSHQSRFYQFLLVWHAPVGVRSTRQHQSPEWTILSHVDCDMQSARVPGCQKITSDGLTHLARVAL